MRRFGLPVAFRTVVGVLADVARLGFLTMHSRGQLAAENLFLRKQFITSRRIRTFGALRSHPRAVERRTPEIRGDGHLPGGLDEIPKLVIVALEPDPCRSWCIRRFAHAARHARGHSAQAGAARPIL